MRSQSGIRRPSVRAALLAGLITALLAPAASADLTTHLTLTIGGQTIVGGSTQAGREGTIEVSAFSLPGFSPVSMTGATGPAQSRPVTITATIDQATPLLAQAWADGANVSSAVFRFYRPTQFGSEENHLTITLAGGKISGFTLTSPDSNDPDLMVQPATVQVSFTYQNLTLTFESPTTSVTRSWQDGQ